MWDYIVLGQIPGTQIQISFEVWLLATAAITLLSLSALAIRTSHTSTTLVAFRISRVLQTTAFSQRLVTRRHIQA